MEVDLSNYRPVMTTSYTLDWLTRFKLKEVNFLYRTVSTVPVSMLATAKFVNQTMSQTMRGTTLRWGIKVNHSAELIGVLALTEIDFQDNSAQLDYVLPEKADQLGVLGEIIPHVLEMLAGAVDFQRLFVRHDKYSELEQILVHNGFTLNEKTKNDTWVSFFK
ncbi:hypothetical protein LFYK43_16950 [Ligilactobacillus salitolerans]|uniref:N-acetyltransferase domain-containing protein n=1 Tax=Ligilactobacillus salitolerans TaxID=1808352 RepID=A0A401IUP4_9LACO|nr:hypothetical protein [Ligilactobacillus salitolerans]GBG95236.1 hypothetical protein LFYK43_16950 [Ligilactobacillus salitolerans]